MKITETGQCHLGVVMGSESYKKEYVSGKVTEWVNELRNLSRITLAEPHPAYTALIFGLKNEWAYVSRTIADIKEMMQPLKDCIRNVFSPSDIKGLQMLR